MLIDTHEVPVTIVDIEDVLCLPLASQMTTEEKKANQILHSELREFFTVVSRRFFRQEAGYDIEEVYAPSEGVTDIPARSPFEEGEIGFKDGFKRITDPSLGMSVYQLTLMNGCLLSPTEWQKQPRFSAFQRLFQKWVPTKYAVSEMYADTYVVTSDFTVLLGDQLKPANAATMESLVQTVRNVKEIQDTLTVGLTPKICPRGEQYMNYMPI